MTREKQSFNLDLFLELNEEYKEPLMHMAPVARVCHQMLRLRLGRGNG